MVRQSFEGVQKIIQWIIILSVISLAAFAVYSTIKHEMRDRPLIHMGSSVFRSELADTPKSRVKGLSGRAEIGKDEAMLFRFDYDDRWGIVMREMNFPIDIIWVNKNKQVVHIEADAQPDAEPYEVYRPDEPARYVIEIAAGRAKQSGVKVGSTVKFEISKRGR